jgi:hypothetical protein
MSAHMPVGLKIPTSTALRRNIEVGILIAASKTVSCLDEICKLYGEDSRMTLCIPVMGPLVSSIIPKEGGTVLIVRPSLTGELLLEVESDLSRQRARRHIVRAAEGGKEIVECVLVGQVDRRELEAHLVLIAVEEVVMSDGNVEKASRRDTRWVLVVVLCIRLRYLQKSGPELRDGTNK